MALFKSLLDTPDSHRVSIRPVWTHRIILVICFECGTLCINRRKCCTECTVTYSVYERRFVSKGFELLKKIQMWSTFQLILWKFIVKHNKYCKHIDALDKKIFSSYLSQWPQTNLQLCDKPKLHNRLSSVIISKAIGLLCKKKKKIK